jgi:fermentation-respiration switch protein FrsA (DUF1100 family)
MRILIIGLAAIAIGYATIVLIFYLFQRPMQYPAPKGYRSPQTAGIADVDEVRLTAADGTEFLLWADLPDDPDVPVVLYFHGNAEALWNLEDRIAMWRDTGFGFAAMSYRGYPGSGGKPSEAALTADAEEAFDWLLAQGIAPQRIIVAGLSIGSGVATALAARRPAGALLLYAPFTSALDVAKRLYPWLPVEPLMRDTWRSIDLIGRVEAPVAIVHGTEDPLMPLSMARAIFAAARDPKLLIEIEGGGHVLPAEAGWPEILAFLQEHLSPAQKAARRGVPAITFARQDP